MIEALLMICTICNIGGRNRMVGERTRHPTDIIIRQSSSDNCTTASFRLYMTHTRLCSSITTHEYHVVYNVIMNAFAKTRCKQVCVHQMPSIPNSSEHLLHHVVFHIVWIVWGNKSFNHTIPRCPPWRIKYGTIRLPIFRPNPR